MIYPTSPKSIVISDHFTLSPTELLFVVVMIATLALSLKIATTPRSAISPLGKILSGGVSGCAFSILLVAWVVKYTLSPQISSSCANIVKKVDPLTRRYFWVPDFAPKLQLPYIEEPVYQNLPTFTFEQILDWLESEIDKRRLSDRAFCYLSSFDKYELPVLIDDLAHIEDLDRYEAIFYALSELLYAADSHLACYTNHYLGKHA